ncbi:hypothetical protein KKB64_03805 [Patescibacteria group bacterium]|nr:hypothetical protein [Patescibacteria group bacterium]MBU1472882.1 hypothetical protein [Patescibacteria group bacterium]MBU2459783.1 hypothetical protein [Patescibacteria group bacterium]MBU2544804.1 hypothetical protein [Patescibacteria group bacterium]
MASNKVPNSFIYFFASIGLIVVTIIMGFIIEKTKSSSTDIRAKAGVINTLKVNGTVTSVDNGVLTVDNVFFADDSRSGPAVNYGTWEVTPPQGYNAASAGSGTTIAITVETKTFDISSHKLKATKIQILK